MINSNNKPSSIFNINYDNNYNMKSILRLYLTTSKGNDQFLYKELVNFHLKPKFDENLFAFYCDVPMTTMFQIAHKSLIT